MSSDMHGYTQGKVIAGQYCLEAVIAETALATFFRARDQMTLEADGTESSLILAVVSDSLTQYPAFESTLQRVLEEFDRPTSPLDIAGVYRDGNTYWLIYNENAGTLVSDLMAKPDRQGMSVSQAQSVLFNIFRAAKNFMSRGGYGFLEPGAILCTGNACKLLNAPLAVVFRVLTGVASIPKEIWVFNSPYISPEVSRGMLPSSQDDTFSLAVIAYMLLGNRLPFGEATLAEAVESRQVPMPLAQVGANGWKVLKQGLSLQRAKRQASPYTLLQGFAGTVAGVEDLADKPTSHLTGKAGLLSKAAVMAGLGILIGYTSYQVYQAPSSDVYNSSLSVATAEQAVTKAVDIEKVLIALPDHKTAEIAAAEPVIPDLALQKPVLAESEFKETTGVANVVQAETVNVADEQKKSEQTIEQAILAEAEAPLKTVSEQKDPPAAQPVKVAKADVSENKGKKAEQQPAKTLSRAVPVMSKQQNSSVKKQEIEASNASSKKTMYASVPTTAPESRNTTRSVQTPQYSPAATVSSPARQVVQVSPNSFVVVGTTSQTQKTVRQIGANTFVVASD